MSVRSVHQFVPTLEPGAVGQHSLLLRDTLRAAGYESEVFAEFIAPAWKDEGLDLGQHRKLAKRGDSVSIYQMAMGSVVFDYVREHARSTGHPVVLNYHNLTPAELLEVWEPAVVHGISWGRRQLAALAPEAALVVADSGFNGRECEALGYRSTVVAPVLVDVDALTSEPDAAALEHKQRTKTGTDWLFVGRVASNKAHHDLVKAFSIHRSTMDPGARLTIVGGPKDSPYVTALRRFASDLGLADAVVFTGPVPPQELSAHYRSADVFVCVSDHEGFCVPLLEAWAHDVPVVAYATTAVPETVGSGGLLLPRKDPGTVAAAVEAVAGPSARPGTRDKLVAAGRRRLADFALAKTKAAHLAALQPVISR